MENKLTTKEIYQNGYNEGYFDGERLAPKDYGAFSGKMKCCDKCSDWGRDGRICLNPKYCPCHTPPAQDTEDWEKEFDKMFLNASAVKPPRDEVVNFIRTLLTHRDTYWKSIIRREVETFIKLERYKWEEKVRGLVGKEKEVITASGKLTVPYYLNRGYNQAVSEFNKRIKELI